MASVTVLCPNGRRVPVKVTPNTSVLEVCVVVCVCMYTIINVFYWDLNVHEMYMIEPPARVCANKSVIYMTPLEDVYCYCVEDNRFTHKIQEARSFTNNSLLVVS